MADAAPPSLPVQQDRALAALRRANALRRGLTLDELTLAAGAPRQGQADLEQALQANPKVELRGGVYFFRARYDAHDRLELARCIALHGDAAPLRFSELAELYPAARRDLDDMTRRAEIVRVSSTDRSMLDDAVFARDAGASGAAVAAAVAVASPAMPAVPFPAQTSPGSQGKPSPPAPPQSLPPQQQQQRQQVAVQQHPAALKVRLSGTVAVAHGSFSVRTQSDLTSEIFRNDVIFIDGRIFRVSSEVLGRSSRGAGKRGAGAGAGASSESEDDGAAIAGSSISSSSSAFAGVVASPSSCDFPSTGVYKASSGNFMAQTGGLFSAGDTAPHRIVVGRSYARPFTSVLLPLDRPFDGPTASGLVAFRIGVSGDLRALWREVVAHGRMLAAAAANAAAAAVVAVAVGPSSTLSSAATTTGSSAGTGSGQRISGGGGNAADSGGVLEGAGGSAGALFLSLGGPAAFRSLRSFPASHRELRDEMARLHLETRMAPGTLDSAQTMRPEAKRLQQQQQQQQQRKQRKTDRRALQLTTADHLDTAVRAAVQKAAEENVRKLIESQQAAQLQLQQQQQQR